MQFLRLPPLMVLCALLTALSLPAVETGDLDGDGDPELLFRYDNMLLSCAPALKAPAGLDMVARPSAGNPLRLSRVPSCSIGALGRGVKSGKVESRPYCSATIGSSSAGKPWRRIASRSTTKAPPDRGVDGIPDVLIGTGRRQDGLESNKVYVVFGEPESALALPDRARGFGGLDIDPEWGENHGFGNFVVVGFDWDGDGVSDVIVGSDVARADIIFGEPTVEAAFVSGDADGNSTANIADAIFGLPYLFAGAARPLCIDTLDADDDGRVLVDDTIYLLSFLFQGGRPPKAPSPSPGSIRSPTR